MHWPQLYVYLKLQWYFTGKQLTPLKKVRSEVVYLMRGHSINCTTARRRCADLRPEVIIRAANWGSWPCHAMSCHVMSGSKLTTHTHTHLLDDAVSHVMNDGQSTVASCPAIHRSWPQPAAGPVTWPLHWPMTTVCVCARRPLVIIRPYRRSLYRAKAVIEHSLQPSGPCWARGRGGLWGVCSRFVTTEFPMSRTGKCFRFVCENLIKFPFSKYIIGKHYSLAFWVYSVSRWTLWFTRN